MKKHTKELLKYPIDLAVHFIVFVLFFLLIPMTLWGQAYTGLELQFFVVQILIISIVLLLAEIIVEKLWMK